MVSLRKLAEEDAVYLLEWMHDPDIQRSFKRNMSELSLEDAKNFCRNAIIPKEVVGGEDLHFAIVNSDDDIYLGTVSLKKIDMESRNAEYAIVLRKGAQGQGVGTEATKLILEKAFKNFGLHRVYLTVLSDNALAIKLYERCGFKYEGELREHLYLRGKYTNWKLYGILAGDYDCLWPESNRTLD